MKRALRSAWVVLLLTAGCGCFDWWDDDHHHGDDDVLVPTTFHVAAMGAAAQPSATAETSWGTADASGSLLSFLIASNSDGVVSGPGPDYLGVDVLGDRTIRLSDPFTDDVIFEGYVRPDESAWIAGTVRKGDLPRVIAGLETWPGTASNADLTGNYHGVIFRFDGSAVSGFNTPTFDGTGGGTVLAGGTFNTDGTISGAGLASPVGYSVSSDGLVTLGTGFGAVGFQGGLHPSGELAVLAGSITSGLTGLFMFVPFATTATTATFSGEYGIVGLSYDYTNDEIRSFTGRIDSDGSGNATLVGDTSVEGTIGTFMDLSATYTVAADGTFTLTTSEGTFSGGLSPSGDFAVLGGPGDALSNPAFYLVVR
jgi:hypothetical protein